MVIAGADVNFDFANTTPLVHAVSGVNPEITKILIEAGANVNKRAKDGRTPLDAAIHRGRLNATPEERENIIQILKTAGATKCFIARIARNFTCGFPSKNI